MRIRVPGDKSISQRALIVAALAEGRSRIAGLLHGGDTESTARALRALGVPVPTIPGDGSEVVLEGVGLDGLRPPNGRLDLGNSGTGARLLMGAVSGIEVEARFDGDTSLRGRPMGRVIRPLRALGARVDAVETPDRLPIVVRGRAGLSPLEWESPIASAQVKSAILLAGLTGRTRVAVIEPWVSRDHTERMLRVVGAPVSSRKTESGWRVELQESQGRIDPLDLSVPGDFSSAAFVLALSALGAAGGEVTVERVGLNPTRTGFLDVLRRMGADVRVDDRTLDDTSEPVGDVVVRPGVLKGTEVVAAEVPGLIDELPLVAVLGACADGEVRISGASELRAKESDRIATVTKGLTGLGVAVEELEDGLVVQGVPGRTLRGFVEVHHDHRIAMAFSVLGAATGRAIRIDDRAVSDVSFPGFHELLTRVAGDRD